MKHKSLPIFNRPETNLHKYQKLSQIEGAKEATRRWNWLYHGNLKNIYL